MPRLSPDTAWRLIVIDTRLPAKSRIAALEQIARPSRGSPRNSERVFQVLEGLQAEPSGLLELSF